MKKFKPYQNKMDVLNAKMDAVRKYLEDLSEVTEPSQDTSQHLRNLDKLKEMNTDLEAIMENKVASKNIIMTNEAIDINWHPIFIEIINYAKEKCKTKITNNEKEKKILDILRYTIANDIWLSTPYGIECVLENPNKLNSWYELTEDTVYILDYLNDEYERIQDGTWEPVSERRQRLNNMGNDDEGENAA